MTEREILELHQNVEYCAWKYAMNEFYMNATEVLEGYRLRDPDNGLIMPWYTWPCLEWLRGLDLKGKRIFEYGVGDSTIWYQYKRATTYGVDNIKDWSDKAAALHTNNQQKYVGFIHWISGEFDIVVIDGIYRDECTEHALKKLKPGGYLIIDNYHQPSVDPNIWTETDRLTKDLPVTLYHQSNHSDWQTAVFINDPQP